MKTLSCDQCDAEFSADTFEAWMRKMMGHYQKDHADFMAAAASKTKEDGEKWMAENRARFDDA